jgi:hypothetical protein
MLQDIRKGKDFLGKSSKAQETKAKIDSEIPSNYKASIQKRK